MTQKLTQFIHRKLCSWFQLLACSNLQILALPFATGALIVCFLHSSGNISTVIVGTFFGTKPGSAPLQFRYEPSKMEGLNSVDMLFSKCTLHNNLPLFECENAFTKAQGYE